MRGNLAAQGLLRRRFFQCAIDSRSERGLDFAAERFERWAASV
jgi:hypothetical protein